MRGPRRHGGSLAAAFAGVGTALVFACDAAAGEQDASAARAGLIDGSRWSLLNRSVHERRDYRHGDTSNGGRNIGLPRSQRSSYAEEWGYGLIGTFESGFTPGLIGLGLDAHVHLAENLAGDDYRVGKIRMLPVDDAGYSQDNIARGGAAFKLRVSSTVLKVGEQRAATPVFSASDSRLLPETMRGWLLSSKARADLVLHAGRFTGSTDRHARSTNNPLIVNYLSPDVRRGETFDLAGATWKAPGALSLSAYHGRLRDTWRTSYLGAQYRIPLQEKRALAMSLHVYASKDTGRALAGRIANTTGSVMATYHAGAHALGLGWQKVAGDTPFDYASRGAIWLGNAMPLSDFNAPREQSWQVRYEANASGVAPGLRVGAAYVRGSGTDGSRTPADGGYAWLGYGKGGRHWTRDLWARYTLQQGPARGLTLMIRYGVHRSNAAQAELDADQVRLSAEYPLGG